MDAAHTNSRPRRRQPPEHRRAAPALIDDYAVTLSARRDADIARALHVTRAVVSNWRSGRNDPRPEYVSKMAEAIGDPTGPWLAAIEADRATTPEARSIWRHAATAWSAGTATGIALISIIQSFI